MVVYDIWPSAKPFSPLGEVTIGTHWKTFAFRSKAASEQDTPAGGVSKSSQVIHPWPIFYLIDNR